MCSCPGRSNPPLGWDYIFRCVFCSTYWLTEDQRVTEPKAYEQLFKERDILEKLGTYVWNEA